MMTNEMTNDMTIRLTQERAIRECRTSDDKVNQEIDKSPIGNNGK